ncbi:hypothetical protein IR083_07940 [Dysgonomonas sp. GY75]|uniref:hypothetical protein n=1 Tax=Dysgonomonas sp. GY75 TaxID=2780419 RepID=UPI00188471A1|nr:hypothetical protein [Dysgonomonas sp. GY75]MBF0648748.1 hypothetical protein [Dysgonomonas sp. GY75]
MNRWNKADYYTIILLKIGWPLFIILIIFIGFIRYVFGEEVDPLDRENLITKREIIGLAEVRDSNACGFDVIYITKHDVTPKRAQEIRTRAHIRENIRKLEAEAPLHFGDMLYTDIYDFAVFAKEYEIDPDIEIHNINVYGDKCLLYIGENPGIKNSARWYNPNTRQGALYITNMDVYKRCDKAKRIYRYWKCGGLHETSSADEHFSHFSEEERIQ